MQNDAERLKRLVDIDTNGAIDDAMRVLQSDIMALLGEFMEVDGLDMRAEKRDGAYLVTVNVRANRFYEVGKLTGN